MQNSIRFNTKRSDKDRQQSGISIGINEHLKQLAKVLSQKVNYIAAAVEQFNLIVILAYFAPKTDSEIFKQELTEVMLHCHGSRQVILRGDFFEDSTTRFAVTLYVSS